MWLEIALGIIGAKIIWTLLLFGICGIGCLIAMIAENIK
jgi:hypothetical protein